MFLKGRYWWIGLGAGLLVVVLYLQSYLVYQQYQLNQFQVRHELQSCLDQAVDQYFQKDAPTLLITVKDLVPGRSFEQFASTVRIDSLSNLPYDSLLVVSMQPLASRKVPVQSYDIVVGQESVDTMRSTNVQNNSVQFSLPPDTADQYVLNKRFKEQLNQYRLDQKYTLACSNPDKILWYYSPLGEFQVADTLTAHAQHSPDKLKIQLLVENQPRIYLARSWSVIFLSGALILLVLSVMYYLIRMIRQAQNINARRNDFVSTIAHELNTPVAVIGASLESIQKFELWREADKLKKYLAMAEENVDKLKQIAEKILDVSTLEDRPLVLKIQQEELVSLISPLLNQFQQTCVNKKFIWILSEAPVLADIDRFYFLQVIDNLLMNAVQYGGDTIQLKLIADASKICIHVSDDGKGISEKSVKHLFSKYYRGNPEVQPESKGYGIGLYLSQKIVIAHGGTLNLTQAQPPVFTLILPCA